MDIIDIGLIIIGILATIVMLIGALFGIALIIAAPPWGKLVGIFFTLTVTIMIVGLWMLILS
jgi:hypothetical protein